MVVTVYPIGTTIYKPEKCYNGYTIIDDRSSWQANLIDMNGKIVNEWKADAERTKLLADGNLLVCVDGARQERDGMGIVEFSWDHKIVWEYKPHGWPARRPHHDVERLSNGNTLVIVHDPIPEEYRDRIRNPVRRNIRTRFGEGRIIADTIYEVTPDKKIVWEWHIWEHLDINREGSYYDSYSAAADWTHTNTVQALPENKWYDDGDKRFKPGNILVSLRNLSLILIVDKETGEIVWEYTGIYEGGLAGQHEPHMIERGIPGEGNIILFDNGAPDQHHHAGESFILEIEPPTGKIIWVYRSMWGGPRWQSKFYGAIESCVQRLPNGNALISEHGGPRVFEVTYDGEIVWEYTIPIHGSMGRCYRYPYDYCPQLEALGKPKEEPVIPPPYVKIEYLKNDTNLAKAYT